MLLCRVFDFFFFFWYLLHFCSTAYDNEFNLIFKNILIFDFEYEF